MDHLFQGAFDTILAGADSAARTAAAEARRARDAALASAIHAIDRSESLTAILTALANALAPEAERSALLLVDRDDVRAWSLTGFGSVADFKAVSGARALAAEAVRSGVVNGSRESGAMAVPIRVGGAVAAVAYADGSSIAADAIELLVRYAARCLEALTGAAALDAIAAEEDNDQESARRYARLLVSEIKLYHHPDVVTGVRERDLGERLGGEIARARKLYEDRFSASAAGADYFQTEVVRTLAGGDPTLLERVRL